MTQKETLILLPGLLCDRRLWQYQVPFFEQEYHVIVPDFSAYDQIDEMAKFILEQGPDSFYLAGLSMGGYVALEMLQMAPDRIKKLALLNTSARADDLKMNRRRRALIGQVKTVGTFTGMTNKLLKLIIDHQHLENESLVKLVKAMTQEVGKEVYLRQQNAILNRQSHLETLEKIQTPILCIGGASDQIISPDETIEMAEMIGQRAALILENCGHLSCLEKPDQVNLHLKKFFDL